MRIALTGATGFIGRAAIEAFSSDGHALRALVRRADDLEDLAVTNLERVQGDLADPAALEHLVRDCGAVLHIAGAIAARDRRAFFDVNEGGTGRVCQAISRSAPQAALVLVSSLAAREPGISAYAASKRAAEDTASALRPDGLAIIRPPAVYGPGDRATLPLIKALAGGRLVIPGKRGNRFSLLHAEDLARLLVAVALREPVPAGEPVAIVEPDDGHAGGYDWQELARITGDVLERPVRVTAVPRGLLEPVAFVADLVNRMAARPQPFGRGKLAELCHADWVARAAHAPPPDLGWRPRVEFAQGLRSTLMWYRERGWL